MENPDEIGVSEDQLLLSSIGLAEGVDRRHFSPPKQKPPNKEELSVSITMEGVSLRVFCFSSLWRMRSSSPVLDLRRGTKKDALPPALGALGRRGVWG